VAVGGVTTFSVTQRSEVAPRMSAIV
jgi:hypothetical protein